MTIEEITKKLNQPTPIQDIDWRVQSITAKNGMIVLGYKDARYDMAMLDEVTGGAWKTDYQRDTKGVLQCTISVYAKLPDGNWDWVSKTSNGVESFSEKEKGEYSDAFKRAGFMWGIGRDLYDLPFIFIQLSDDEVYMKGQRKVNKLNPNDLVWTRDSKGLLTAKQGNKVRFKERPSSANQAKTAAPSEEESTPTTEKPKGRGWDSRKDAVMKYLTSQVENINKTKVLPKEFKENISKAMTLCNNDNEFKLMLVEVGFDDVSVANILKL